MRLQCGLIGSEPWRREGPSWQLRVGTRPPNLTSLFAISSPGYITIILPQIQPTLPSTRRSDSTVQPITHLILHPRRRRAWRLETGPGRPSKRTWTPMRRRIYGPRSVTESRSLRPCPSASRRLKANWPMSRKD